jgi:hypothetical protein
LSRTTTAAVNPYVQAISQPLVRNYCLQLFWG